MLDAIIELTNGECGEAIEKILSDNVDSAWGTSVITVQKEQYLQYLKAMYQLALIVDRLDSLVCPDRHGELGPRPYFFVDKEYPLCGAVEGLSDLSEALQSFLKF